MERREKSSGRRSGEARRAECWLAAVRNRCRRWQTILCALAMLFVPWKAMCQLANEQAIKTAFVFNLTKYVEWPQARDQIVIGFVGDGTMGESLRSVLEGKSSDARTIRVVLYPSDEDLLRCDVIYLAPSSEKKFHLELEKVRNKAILTVGDADWFAREGGMVGMVRDRGQIHLQINLQAAQTAGLKISSRLLNLAEIVPGAKGTGN
jgi:hypothetical protein